MIVPLLISIIVIYNLVVFWIVTYRYKRPCDHVWVCDKEAIAQPNWFTREEFRAQCDKCGVYADEIAH